jgi:hypothetical protein
MIFYSGDLNFVWLEAYYHTSPLANFDYIPPTQEKLGQTFEMLNGVELTFVSPIT